MVGLVGIGNMPEHFLRKVRYWRKRLVPITMNYVYVYPEFFDDKKLLLSGKWIEYRTKLINIYNDVEKSVWIAVYPDHQCRWLNFPSDIQYVYPIHDLENDWKCLEIINKHTTGWNFAGYPSGEYNIRLFLEKAKELGYGYYDLWYMGLKPKHIKYMNYFYGVDLTTMSIPGYNFEKIKRDGARAIIELAIKLLKMTTYKQKTLEQYLKVISGEQ